MSDFITLYIYRTQRLINRSSSSVAAILARYTWVVDQVRSQHGWILAKFISFACLWTEMGLISISMQKIEQGQYPVILIEQPWSIKDFLYG